MALVAIVVAAGGAGVLIAMWLLMEWSDDIHVWPDFRSGSYGDVVLLPVLTAALVGIRSALPPADAVLAPRAAGVFGGLVGLAVQVGWAADPAPPPTWTFTRPHVFSVPGAWHAVFFVVMGAVVAWLTVGFVVQARALRGSPTLRSPWLSGALGTVVAAVASFTGLVALDSAASADTVSSTSTLIALGVTGVVTIAVFAWALGRVSPQLALSLGLALVAAAALVLLFVDWPPSGVRLMLGVGVGLLMATPLFFVPSQSATPGP